MLARTAHKAFASGNALERGSCAGGSGLRGRLGHTGYLIERALDEARSR